MSYMSYPTLAKSQKTSSTNTIKEPTSKRAVKPKGSEKSKEGMNDKSGHSKKIKGAEEPKGSEKSKEGMNGKIQHSKKFQKSRDFTKYVRSSLPNLSDEEQSVEQIPETANTLSSANVESSASAHVIKGAFIVAISFVVVVAGVLIAA